MPIIVQFPGRRRVSALLQPELAECQAKSTTTAEKDNNESGRSAAERAETAADRGRGGGHDDGSDAEGGVITDQDHGGPIGTRWICAICRGHNSPLHPLRTFNFIFFSHQNKLYVRLST